MLAVLRRRDFGLLWLAGLVSVAGDWVLATALPYVIYVQTGSVLATAGMVAAELVPSIVLGSFAGVFVDRWDRRRVLVVSNLLQAAVVVTLLLAADGALAVVYVVAAAQSALAAFAQPAESALLPSLVGEDELVPANALNVLNNRLGRLVGTPVGAVLLSLLGLEAVVVADALTFVLAAGLVASMTPTSGARAAGHALAEAESALARFWAEWLAGLRTVREDRTVAVLFVVFGLMTFGGTMLDPLFVPWVTDVLGQGVGAVAVLTTTSSLAGIVGSLLVGGLGRRASARSLIGWGSLVAGIVLLLRANLPFLWVAVALSAVGGVTAVASSVGVETLAQERTPEHLRGRVFGSLQATVWLASLLGAVVGGVVGELVGLLPALDVASVLVGLSGVVVLLVLRPRGDAGAREVVTRAGRGSSARCADPRRTRGRRSARPRPWGPRR
ncbi:MFS transporter [Nocardioides eburneiflavus]|uniref:MFS transporter n=1 Tax=Nocardioides eburneiflavus TaxID=2518372 RepID=A0A4Z1CLZ8_9ACTN|nr:MFS transporter [Nocardioides eburneiflavus]TGN62919.1 MFS transporter [Nocardioides eburneiflavus]